MHVHAYICCSIHVQVRGQLGEVNFLYHVDSKDQIYVLRLGEHPYLSSHLAGPGVVSKRSSYIQGHLYFSPAFPSRGCVAMCSMFTSMILDWDISLVEHFPNMHKEWRSRVQSLVLPEGSREKNMS